MTQLKERYRKFEFFMKLCAEIVFYKPERFIAAINKTVFLRSKNMNKVVKSW